MDQYGINCLSKAYEALPRQLAENSGNDPSKAISKLLAAHAALEGNLIGQLQCNYIYHAFTNNLHLFITLSVFGMFCVAYIFFRIFKKCIKIIKKWYALYHLRLF